MNRILPALLLVSHALAAGAQDAVHQDTSGGWFGAEWRFAPRHRVGLTYSRFTLRGERVRRLTSRVIMKTG